MIIYLWPLHMKSLRLWCRLDSNSKSFFFLPPSRCSDLLVRLVSVDLHTFGPDALTAVRLIEHQASADQAAEVRPQLVEQVPPAVQGAPAPGKRLHISSGYINPFIQGSCIVPTSGQTGK